METLKKIKVIGENICTECQNNTEANPDTFPEKEERYWTTEEEIERDMRPE
jgi:hypothetical protein